MDGHLLPELVACEPLTARMTAPGCTRRWRMANEGEAPDPGSSLSICRGCILGAERAGVNVGQAVFDALVERAGRVCPRCERLAPRLIRGRWCVSCFNRAREVARGRNGKGGRPVVLLSRLREIRVSVAEGDAAPRLEAQQAVGAAELVIHFAARATGPIAIGRAPAPPPEVLNAA